MTTPTSNTNHSYNAGGSSGSVQPSWTPQISTTDIVAATGAGLILLAGSRFGVRGVQALGLGRRMFSYVRPSLLNRSTQPTQSFVLKQKPPKVFIEFMKEARTKEIPDVKAKVEQLPMKQHVWGEIAIAQANELQSLHKMQKSNKAFEEAFPKYFKGVVFTLTAIAAGTFQWAMDKQNTKQDEVDEKINAYIDEIKEKGQQLEAYKTKRSKEVTIEQQKLTHDIMALIAKLPENKQELIKQDLLGITHELAETLAEEEKIISSALQSFTELQHRPVSALHSGVKDYSSYLAATCVELGIAVAFNRLSLAQTLVQNIVKTGVPQAFTERLISGLLVIGMKEGVLFATTQNITEEELQNATHDVLKQLDIDPTQSEELSAEEIAMSRHLGSIATGIVGRTVSILAGNDLMADLMEIGVTATHQLAIEGQLQQYVVQESIDQQLQKHLEPTKQAIQHLEERMIAVYDASIEPLTEVKGALEAKVAKLEARTRQEQAEMQARVRAEENTSWISRQFNRIPSLSSILVRA